MGSAPQRAYSAHSGFVRRVPADRRRNRRSLGNPLSSPIAPAAPRSVRDTPHRAQQKALVPSWRTRAFAAVLVVPPPFAPPHACGRGLCRSGTRTTLRAARNRRALPGASRCRLLGGAHDLRLAACSPAGSRVSHGGTPAAALAAVAPLSARRHSPRSVPFVAAYCCSVGPRAGASHPFCARVCISIPRLPTMRNGIRAWCGSPG